MTTIRVDFHLLDRQIVDLRGVPVGKVDDVELARDEDGTLVVVALLSGGRALADRFGGVLGRWLRRAARRPALRVGYEHVARVGSAVELSLPVELLDPPPLEEWLRENVIGWIPGARRAGE
ncbi:MULTISPECIES: hypothetical protein [Actinosynnema]|uniref:hypothetical protein n=1 Tax=Actinosynnema TaxID=40566 RepID=UPI0020A3ACB6|nr:hypothetical protein [Actinosynnema pretiosum]MCP2098834.1 hypothetical protein [Actinosynnema pretiosum]